MLVCCYNSFHFSGKLPIRCWNMGFAPRHMSLVIDAAEIAKAVNQKGDPSYCTSPNSVLYKSLTFKYAQLCMCCTNNSNMP